MADQNKYADLPDTWIKALLVALDGDDKPEKEVAKPTVDPLADTWLDVLLRELGDKENPRKQRPIYRDRSQRRKPFMEGE